VASLGAYLDHSTSSSVEYDRDIKLPAYGRSGILEVWIANLTAEIVEAHTELLNGSYRTVRSHRRGDSIMPLHFPDLSIVRPPAFSVNSVS